jgi:hypothetical protein
MLCRVCMHGCTFESKCVFENHTLGMDEMSSGILYYAILYWCMQCNSMQCNVYGYDTMMDARRTVMANPHSTRVLS